MGDSSSQPPIFDGCCVAFVPSEKLTQPNIVQLQDSIEINGGTVSETKADGTVRLSEVTHIIAATSDFPQYYEACEHMIPVVTSYWIAESLMKGKQAPLRPYTPDPHLFFSGVNVTCADIPPGDKDAIIGAVIAMGGQESPNLTKLVTHIVALTLDHPICQKAIEKKLKCKIVLPHWFDDCLKIGTKIDEKPYCLPGPEILRLGKDAPVPIPTAPEMVGATAARPDYLPTPLDAKRTQGLAVFESKKVMLAEDLNINDRLRGILENLITDGGGSITNSVYNASIYVCQWREGKDYVTASRSGKDVGNLMWLFHLIAHNQWTSPFRRLLHYPLPKGGIEGFKGTRITLSNYGGEARIYLENLVQAAGGEFTKSMKQDNTHLITARDNSEKCQAAKEWNIHMVNHLWIEESYANCKMQSVTNPKYTHFPARTNLGEVVGRVEFDRKILELMYYPEDVASPESMRKARQVIGVKENIPAATQEDVTMAMTDAPDPEDEEPSVGIVPAPRETPKPAKSTPVVSRTKRNQQVTPASSSIARLGKENETPSTTGSSRAAKTRAVSKLHDAAADIELYEKERKRSTSKVWGGERAANQIEKTITAKRRSKSLEKQEESEEGSEEEEARPTKRARISDSSRGPPLKAPVKMRLMITGDKRWLDAPGNKEEQDKKNLRELGVLIVADPTNCTHLAAPAMVRTQKFLCALASSVMILNAQFIDACLSSNKLPDTSKYVLVDRDNEKRFGVKLADAVKRAQKNKRALLAGTAVFATPSIPNGTDTYKSIVEANGGEFAVYNPNMKLAQREEGEQVEVYLISGVTAAEKALWPKFRRMAEGCGHEARVVGTEWLLDTAMHQSLLWKQSYLLK